MYAIKYTERANTEIEKFYHKISFFKVYQKGVILKYPTMSITFKFCFKAYSKFHDVKDIFCYRKEDIRVKIVTCNNLRREIAREIYI